jgi:hypothetical protein
MSFAKSCEGVAFKKTFFKANVQILVALNIKFKIFP